MCHTFIPVSKYCICFSLISILQILSSPLSLETLFSAVHMHSCVCMHFKDTILGTSHTGYILFYLQGNCVQVKSRTYPLLPFYS